MLFMTGFHEESTFELPLVYEGKEWLLPARFVQMGYTYKIFIDVNGQEIIFEPDEERNLRTIIENQNDKLVSAGLVKAIGAALESQLK